MNSFPIIYIKGKWCNSVVIKVNCGKGIFFKTHVPNKSDFEEKITINRDFKINIKENARDTTYFTTKWLQTDMTLRWHVATSALKTIIIQSD